MIARRLAAALTALLLALTLSVPSPARAAWNDCLSGWICVWKNTNYWGELAEFRGPLDQCVESPQPNGTSAIRNHTAYHTRIYEFTGCGGQSMTVYGLTSIAAIPAPWHDRVRSIRILSQ